MLGVGCGRATSDTGSNSRAVGEADGDSTQPGDPNTTGQDPGTKEPDAASGMRAPDKPDGEHAGGDGSCGTDPMAPSCEAIGGFCGNACPEGYTALYKMPCDDANASGPNKPGENTREMGSGTNSGEGGVCCIPGEDPGPPRPIPSCEDIGFVCADWDEATQNFECPQGLEPRFDLACDSNLAGDGSGNTADGGQTPGGDPTDPNAPYFYKVCCGIAMEPDPTPEPCPDANDPATKYMRGDPGTCEQMGSECPQDTKPFISECGCGCIGLPPETPPPPPRGNVCPDPTDQNVIYVSEDTQICDAIQYICPSNSVPFTSDCGCGCLSF